MGNIASCLPFALHAGIVHVPSLQSAAPPPSYPVLQSKAAVPPSVVSPTKRPFAFSSSVGCSQSVKKRMTDPYDNVTRIHAFFGGVGVQSV